MRTMALLAFAGLFAAETQAATVSFQNQTPPASVAGNPTNIHGRLTHMGAGSARIFWFESDDQPGYHTLWADADELVVLQQAFWQYRDVQLLIGSCTSSDQQCGASVVVQQSSALHYGYFMYAQAMVDVMESVLEALLAP